MQKYVSMAEQFAKLLRENWNKGGSFLSADGMSGKWKFGGLDIEFEESGNDPAIWVTVKEFKFKTTPDQAMSALHAIKTAYQNAGL